MWVLTTTGFVSAVEHRDDPRLLLVRARHRDDIAQLCRAVGTELIEGGGTDYEFRTVVAKETFAAWLADQAAAIDYPNFKDAVAERQDYARADVYGDVWATLQRLAELPLRSRRA